MGNHQMIYYQMKSQLFDLLTVRGKNYTYVDLYELISGEIKKHFKLSEIHLLLLNPKNKCYVPIKEHPEDELQKWEQEFSNDHHFPIDSTLSMFQKNGFSTINQAIRLYDEQELPIGILLVKTTPSWEEFAQSVYLELFQDMFSGFIRKLSKEKTLKIQEKKYRKLFNVTEQFNATMESEVILAGIEETANTFFPSFAIQIVLSQEEQLRTRTYKLFDYLNERSTAIEAYMSGKVTSEICNDTNQFIINAPINGRQGIYGLLKMSASPEYQLNEVRLNLLKVLTNTAGSALENAILYDQSHRLIDDLQLVNETLNTLNRQMPFDEMLQYLQKQFMKAFRPTELAFVFFEKDDYKIVNTHSDFFTTEEGRKYLHYTALYIEKNKESLFTANIRENTSVLETYAAIIGIPIMNQEDVVGFVICLHEEPYYFSFDSFKLMTSLIGHTSLALANSMLRDQLQELVDKDHLTTLYTRRYLDAFIERSIAKHEGGVLLLFDIDNFKQVNDTYGHDMGDFVLRQIGEKLMTELDGGLAARWGGEEFAVFFARQSLQYGQRFAQRLLAAIPNVTSPSVTVSIGMTAWESEQEVAFKGIFKRADAALYSAKHNGKNQVMIHGSLSS